MAFKDTKFGEALVRGANKAKFKINENSPTILIVGGIVGGVAATVMACKATRNVDTVLEEHTALVEAVKEADIPEDTKKKEIFKAYFGTCKEFAKLYGPATILGISSIISILEGNKKHVGRHAAATAMATGWQKKAMAMRDMIAEKYGEEASNEIYYGIHNEEIEETYEDEKTGKTKKRKVSVPMCDPQGNSIFSFYFDDGDPGWTKDPHANKKYVVQVMNHLADMLRVNHFISFNDVRKAFGKDSIPEANNYGKVYDPKVPGYDDPSVMFKVFVDLMKEENRLFVDGFERTCLIDMDMENISEAMAYIKEYKRQLRVDQIKKRRNNNENEQ